jgi:hypothetical protein
MQCLDDQGVPHSEPVVVETLDGIQWDYHVGPMANEVVDAQMKLHDECDAEFLSTVRSMWVTQNAPTEDQLQQRGEAYASCLREAGMDVSSAEEAEALFRQGRLDKAQQAERIRGRSKTYSGESAP